MNDLDKALAWAFESPGRIQQHEWELRTFLGKVISELKPERTVELGSWKGTTAAILSLVTSGQTVSLDKDEYGGKEESLKLAKGKNLIFKISDAMKPESLSFVHNLFGGKMIDLLFLDDGHRMVEVTTEYKLWSPFVRTGGWIVFHDINPDANQCAPGVHPDICMAHEFWENVKGNTREIVFHGDPPGPGIGILIV